MGLLVYAKSYEAALAAWNRRAEPEGTGAVFLSTVKAFERTANDAARLANSIIKQAAEPPTRDVGVSK